MLDIELAAHNAWDEYYNTLAQRTIRPKGRGYTVHGSKYIDAFLAIAKHCMEHSYDVRDYVATSLQLLVKDAIYITPKDLANGGAYKRYAEAFNHRGNRSDIQQSWDSQCSFAHQQQVMYPADCGDMVGLLFPLGRPFTIWFRVFYPEDPNPELIEEYGEEAWQEIARNPNLRGFLAERRPAVMEALQAKFGYFGDPLPGGVK